MSAINYQKVDWKDAPNHETPLNATNLKKMDNGIYDLDQIVGAESAAVGVEGDTVFEKIHTVSAMLSANGNKAELTYSSGKYGFTIDGIFYEIGGGGMPDLNYTTPLHTFNNTNSWPATEDCWVGGRLPDADVSVIAGNVVIGGTIRIQATGGSSGYDHYNNYSMAFVKVPKGISIRVTSACSNIYALAEL